MDHWWGLCRHMDGVKGYWVTEWGAAILWGQGSLLCEETGTMKSQSWEEMLKFLAKETASVVAMEEANFQKS